MHSSSDRQIDWEIARLSGGLSAARRFTPAHQGSLRPSDWNLEESEDGPLSERGDVLVRDLAAYHARTQRSVIESIAPMAMETAAFATGSDARTQQTVSTRRKRLNRGADAMWAGAAAGMSVLALGLVTMLGLGQVAPANAALPAAPPTSRTTTPAAMAMATEGVPFTARPTVMLDPVHVSGDASTPGARTAPARAAAPVPAAAMAASRDAIPPQGAATKVAGASEPASDGISRSAAAAAISTAGRRAASCLQPGDPRGGMPVSVTFAPSGRVTTSTVNGGPFAGTTTGGCIARALRSARVAPFEGAPVTVHSSVSFR